MGGGGRGAPSGDHLSENLLSCRIFVIQMTGFRRHRGEMMHEHMNLLALKPNSNNVKNKF